MNIYKEQMAALGDDSINECPLDNNKVTEIKEISGAKSIRACCGIYYFEAIFKEKPKAKATERVKWVLIDRTTGIPPKERYFAQDRKNWFTLRDIPEEWVGRPLKLIAYLHSKKSEGVLLLSVDRCEICEFINLVKKVETANSAWTSEEVLNAIRHTAPQYDNDNWQKMLNQSRPGKEIKSTIPKTKETKQVKEQSLSETDRQSIAQFVHHTGNTKGKEGGIAVDCHGYDLAVGHVITGICGGLYRNKNLDISAALHSSLRITAFGEKIDNLYATTIAGDLGQSATWINEGKQKNLIGDGTGATHAELVGDIDGFILGEMFAYSLRSKTKKLSALLEEYYCCNDLSQSGYMSANRFLRFSQLVTPEVLLDQTKRFATNYNYTLGKFSGAFSLSGDEAENVVDEFFKWLNQKKIDESNRLAKESRTYTEFTNR